MVFPVAFPVEAHNSEPEISYLFFPSYDRRFHRVYEQITFAKMPKSSFQLVRRNQC